MRKLSPKPKIAKPAKGKRTIDSRLRDPGKPLSVQEAYHYYGELRIVRWKPPTPAE